jgi:hypothetical protein
MVEGSVLVVQLFVDIEDLLNIFKSNLKNIIYIYIIYFFSSDNPSNLALCSWMKIHPSLPFMSKRLHSQKIDIFYFLNKISTLEPNN